MANETPKRLSMIHATNARTKRRFMSCCSTQHIIAGANSDTVRVDLNPLIDGAAHTRSQFAVNVHHHAAPGSTAPASPTAVSLSFHAPYAVLPPSDVLNVSNGRTSFRWLRKCGGNRPSGCGGAFPLHQHQLTRCECNGVAVHGLPVYLC